MTLEVKLLKIEDSRLWQKLRDAQETELLHTVKSVAQMAALLLPAETLWLKPLTDWTEADWQNQDNISSLWLIDKGRVTAARGTHTLDEIRRIRVPYDQLSPNL